MTQIQGWLVSLGLGTLAGFLVGFGATGDHTHAQWPVLAGFALGLFGALVAPTRQVPVALGGAAVAVVAAVTTKAAVLYQNGFWPIADEFRIAHFGSTAQAVLRGAAIYGALIGVPCLLTARLVAATTRRCGRVAQRDPGAVGPRDRRE